MEFDSKMIRFDMYDIMKYTYDLSYVCNTDALEALNQQYFNLSHGDKVNITLCNNLNTNSLEEIEEDHVTSQDLQEACLSWNPLNR